MTFVVGDIRDSFLRNFLLADANCKLEVTLKSFI